MTEQEQADLLAQFMLDHGIKRCLCCQASMSKSNHHMTKVLVNALVKIARAVAVKRENDIRVDKMTGYLTLTHIERCNFHKLRMHGLIARVKVEGVVKRGRWLITRRGWHFIQGTESVPTYVQSFRNKVVGKSDELISVSQVLGETPYCETAEDQLFDLATEDDLNVVVKAYTGRKKRKNACPHCQKGQMKPRLAMVSFREGVASAQKVWACSECSYTTENDPRPTILPMQLSSQLHFASN